MTTFEIWMTVLTAVAIIASSSVSIWAVVSGVRRSDFAELQRQLNVQAVDLVNAKFSNLAAEMKSPLAVLNTIVDQIDARLEWGDGKLSTDSEKLHQVEMACRQAGADTRSWAMEHFATHVQLSGMSAELGRLRAALARCQRACRIEEVE